MASHPADAVVRIVQILPIAIVPKSKNYFYAEKRLDLIQPFLIFIIY